MKTITSLFILITVVILTSCEGPVGPVGPPGENGTDAEIGQSVKVYGDFTPGNNYTLLYDYKNDLGLNVYDDDAVLVYILWAQEETGSGGLTDVWRLLPQTVVLNDGGILQYNYDFTSADLKIFLEGATYNLNSSETDNQVFKVVVLPSAFLAKNKSLDVTDLNMVLKSMNKNINSIERIIPSVKSN